ncbi:MAG TPA: Holliday junction resolvase RuvX [Candidatus Limnocylindrales bacterium]
MTEDAAILGLDVGSRRIGVALAEAGAITARPLTTIVLSRGRPGAERIAAGPEARALAAIERLVAEHRIAEVVVGLPLEAGGAEGAMAEAARSWADALGERLGLAVALRDERLTSSIAEGRVGPMPRGRSGGPPSREQRERYRARVDREAAAIILQDELDARRSVTRSASR